MKQGKLIALAAVWAAGIAAQTASAVTSYAVDVSAATGAIADNVANIGLVGGGLLAFAIAVKVVAMLRRA